MGTGKKADAEKKDKEEAKVEPIEVVEHPTLREALLYAMMEYPPLRKDTEVNVTTQRGGYSYKYTDLAQTRLLTDPCLRKHGLYVVDETLEEDEKEYLASTLVHIHSIEEKSTRLEITEASSDMKNLGGNMTYARRYNYCNLTGRVAEEDSDTRDVQRKGKEQEGQAKPGGAQGAKATALKTKYFPFLNENKIFAADDARHDWQEKWMLMRSTEQWKNTDVTKAVKLLTWRMEVGIESDKLMDFLNTKAKSVNGLTKSFLEGMDVKAVTEIKDVAHWRIAMTAAKLSIDHKLEAAINMGKALMRAAQYEGMYEQFLLICETDKLSKLNKETVVKWEELLRESIDQWNDMPDRGAQVSPDSILEEPVEMDPVDE